MGTAINGGRWSNVDNAALHLVLLHGTIEFELLVHATIHALNVKRTAKAMGTAKLL
tara:strand:- start:23141 stop:23308 length:168 start_codon:yes stop_codon:yes gene_type:complete